MRLIDADALFSALNDAKWYDNADREIALDYVEDAPTVDAVQVVRCKDCEFWDDTRGILTYHACRLWSAVNSTRYTADMDFCNKGERADV
jgi:hypothetical protein